MITSLRLQNFRSYKDAAFDVGSGVNIVVGPNASGKTNLLEALLVLSLGSSYRAKTAELLKFNQSWARVDAQLKKGGRRTAKIKLLDQKAGKTFEIDNKPYFRLGFDATLPVVLFEPGHLLMLTGKPQRRRDYLDDLLGQITPSYAKIRRDYRRALAQRNSLLKKGPQTRGQLFAWNVRLSELGGQINQARFKLVAELNDNLGRLYKKLSGGKVAIVAEYTSPITPLNYQSRLLQKLEKNVDLDYLRGFTSLGPHRDDMQIMVDKRPAQDVASRGEIRTIVLALKILELGLLEKIRGQKPLLLLDDVFSELDGARRKALTTYLKNYQTFITTTDADVVAHNFAQKCTVISI